MAKGKVRKRMEGERKKFKNTRERMLRKIKGGREGNRIIEKEEKRGKYASKWVVINRLQVGGKKLRAFLND